MIGVRLASAHDIAFVLRQTPAGDGAWDPIRVTLDPDAPHDWLLVVDDAPAGLETRVPPARRILALTEPPAIRRYPARFLAQFGVVAGAATPPGFRGARIGEHALLPWYYGVAFREGARRTVRDWPALAAGPPGDVRERAGLVSAVTSTKRVTANQIRRLRLLDRLAGALGPRLALFGRGFAEIADKAAGIDGYRYHLVLENNLDPGFWTEKLADAILGGAFPIVAGGGDLARWFDPAGFAAIDPRRPRAAVAAVEALLADDPVARPETRRAMAENRRRLMEERQLFPVIARHVAEAPRPGDPPLDRPVPIRRVGKDLGARLSRATRRPRLALAGLAIALAERG